MVTVFVCPGEKNVSRLFAFHRRVGVVVSKPVRLHFVAPAAHQSVNL